MNTNELKPLTNDSINEYLADAVGIAPLFKQEQVSLLCGWTKTAERQAKRVAIAAERLTPPRAGSASAR